MVAVEGDLVPMRPEGEVSVLLKWIADEVPELRAAAMTVIERGWDWIVLDGNGWIVRVARRPKIAERIGVEKCLLAWLADDVGLPAPQVERSADDPAFMLYRRLPGVEVAEVGSVLSATAGRAAVSALRVLHDQPVDQPRACGVPEDSTPSSLGRFHEEVLPLLPSRSWKAGKRLLDSYPSSDVEVRLTHSDIAGDHLLVDAATGEITGIIDWSDAQIADPALDLAWTLNRAPVAFRKGFLESYEEIDASLALRAEFYFRLTPWHDVLFGVEMERPELVKAGLERVMARLPSLAC